jgi:hypothetical protein
VQVDIVVAGDLLEPRQTVVDDLRSLQPAVAVVGIFGFGDDERGDLREDDLAASLSTPFSLDELCAVIAAARRGVAS